jgi:RNA polymerase sigma-70 factor (ECF subfamily)
LTQGFFARVLEKDYLGDVEPSRGRFRSFLLSALRHYVSNERDFANAKRRGGGVQPLSLDFAGAEGRYLFEPPDERTPDRLYERDWALALLDRVLAQLRQEWSRAGKEEHFEFFKAFLTGDPTVNSYREAAGRLGMTEGAFKVGIHRIRKRYRALLEAEISETVDNPEDVRQEIRFLFGALSV